MDQSQLPLVTIPAPSGPLLVTPYTGPDPIDFSLVLPTFREARNIQNTLRAVVEVLRSVPDLDFEIIVVDDDSPDRTWQLALEESAELPEVRVIRRTTEHGLATAVIRGWQASRGRLIGVMDADLQHPPGLLAELVRAVQSGSDLAAGSRHVIGGGVSDWSLGRRIISRSAQMIGLVLLPEVVGRVADPMSGYFALKRDVVCNRPLNPTGYKILIEILSRGAVRSVTEIGYVFREREKDESKVTAAIYLQYLQHLLRLRILLLRESRFVRFCLVGLSGMLVDMTLLYLLSDPHALHWGLTRSKLIAAESAMVNNFFWNDRWTFGDLVGEARSLESRLHRFLKFNSICFIGLVLNILLLNLQFNLLGMNRYEANAIAILVATFWNYQVNKHLGWRSSK